MYVKLFYSKISLTPKPKYFTKLNYNINDTKIYICKEWHLQCKEEEKTEG